MVFFKLGFIDGVIGLLCVRKVLGLCFREKKGGVMKGKKNI